MEPFRSIYELKVIREKREGYFPNHKYRNSADVYLAFKDRFDKLDREEFLVLCLDAKNNLIGFNQVSVGSLTMSLVHPREVWKAAILANAASIILLHNHPTGDPLPSAEDLQITKRIREIGELFGIRVLDHIIVGDNRYVSFVDDCYWDKTV